MTLRYKHQNHNRHPYQPNRPHPPHYCENNFQTETNHKKSRKFPAWNGLAWLSILPCRTTSSNVTASRVRGQTGVQSVVIIVIVIVVVIIITTTTTTTTTIIIIIIIIVVVIIVVVIIIIIIIIIIILNYVTIPPISDILQ